MPQEFWYPISGATHDLPAGYDDFSLGAGANKNAATLPSGGRAGPMTHDESTTYISMASNGSANQQAVNIDWPSPMGALTGVLTAGARTAMAVGTPTRGQYITNAAGTLAVVHGHGDNLDAVSTWAPRFRGRTVATTQSRPVGRLENFGGFTDGDRAVFLADHFGAARIHLVGFDFERPNPKDADATRKRRKLDWAYILLSNLQRDDLDL